MAILTLSSTIPEILFVTLLQEQVSDSKLGRVSSIYQLASFGTWPLGFAICGVAADRLGPVAVFLGAGLMIVVLYGLALFNRSVRQAR